VHVFNIYYLYMPTNDLKGWVWTGAGGTKFAYTCRDMKKS
jgi:hypothetical protein